MEKYNNEGNSITLTNNILICFAGVLFWFLFPMFTILPALYLLGSKKLKLYGLTQILLITCISFSFGLIAYVTGSGGINDTDMIRYRHVFSLMPYRTVSELVYNGTNFFFVFLNWIIANFISRNEQLMSLIFTFISYYLFILSVYKLAKNELKGNYIAYVLISITFIVSIITTTEYLKQVLSMSLWFYALVLKLNNEKKGYQIILIILSILVHISSFYYLILFAFNINWVKKNIILIFFACLIFVKIDLISIFSYIASFSSLQSLLESLKILERLEAYGDGYSSFGGSKRYFLIFLFYIVELSPIFLFFRKKKDTHNPINVLFILSICLILINFSNVANFARITRTLYPLQLLALVYSLRYINIRYRSLWCIFIVGSLFTSNCIEFYRTMINTNYHATFMGNDWLLLMLSNISEILSYKV